MTQICSRCGGTSFHYNRSRIRMECSSCGAPLSDDHQQEQQMQFDRTYAQAMAHILAGNWNQAISLLTSLANQYPTEKKLYLAILQAATADFQDLDMTDSARRSTACQAWNKLVRLNHVTPQMILYGRSRRKAFQARMARQRKQVLTWLFLTALFIMLGLTALGTGNVGLAAVWGAGLAGSLYKLSHCPPLRINMRQSDPHPKDRDNPFV